MQNIRKIQRKLQEELITQNMYYQPLKTLSVWEKIFFQHQTFMHIFNQSVNISYMR